jgi:hypothetical protein
MAKFLKFAMNLYTVDADGKRYPGVKPILFRLKTPIEDFREAAPGFPQGYWWNVQTRLSTNVMREISDQATPIGPFAALSEKYEKRKAKKYGEQPILIASGEMLEGFFSGSDHVFEEGPMGMKWGNRNPLAGYHFRGHLAGEGGAKSTLPRRPLGMPPEDFGGTLQSDAVRYVGARYRIAGFRVGKEAGVGLTRVQASQVGKMVLGGEYGAVPLAQTAAPI